MIGGLGIWELILIFGILVLLFGARKLPEIGRGLGEGIRSFKDALNGNTNDENKDIKVVNPNVKEIEAGTEKKVLEAKEKEKTTV